MALVQRSSRTLVSYWIVKLLACFIAVLCESPTGRASTTGWDVLCSSVLQVVSEIFPKIIIRKHALLACSGKMKTP